MEPVPELKLIRGEKADFTNIQLTDEGQILNIQGAALEVDAEFEATGTIGIAMVCSPDGQEQTRIIYDPKAKRLVVNREQSSLAEGNETFANEAPHELLSGEILQLHILLDGSVLEVIANGRTSVCSRIYPSRRNSQGIRLFGQGLLKSMTIWQMASIWPE